jgi:putative ABC transport system permease protein
MSSLHTRSFLRRIRKDWEIYTLKSITLSVAFATAILVVSFYVSEFSVNDQFDDNVVRILQRNETKEYEGRNRLSNRIPDEVSKHFPGAWTTEDHSVYATLVTDLKTAETEVNRLFPGSSFTYILQPASEIYFGPRVVGESTRHGDIYCVIILGCISLLIIVLAATNFVNLVSLTLPTRSKELAMRKVAGAHRSPLLGLMAKESGAVVIISLLIGIALFVAFPSPITIQVSPTAIVILVILVLIVIAAPLFPAWAFVKASPGRLLSTDTITFPRMKKVITVFQLGVSISPIIASLVIDRQISRSLIKEPGKNHDQVVYVPYPSQLTRESYNRLKLDWPRNNPNIVELTAVSHTPDNLTSKNIGDDHFRMNVDYDFKDFFRLEMASGRWFGPNDQDSTIVNEVGADSYPTNMGIIEDFSDSPVRITVGKNDYNFLMIRVLEVDIRSTLTVISRFFEEISGRPVSISYFDKNYAAIIAYEDSLNKLSSLLAIVGCIMACCSIYALSLSRMNDNIKQIVIRKVFGASDSQIVGQLSIQFLQSMLGSIFFFGPLTYLLLREWLRLFAYSARFNWFDPLIAIGVCLVIVLIMNISILLRLRKAPAAIHRDLQKM